MWLAPFSNALHNIREEKYWRGCLPDRSVGNGESRRSPASLLTPVEVSNASKKSMKIVIFMKLCQGY